MNQNEALFRDAPVKKAVFQMAVPTVISSLVLVVYNMADFCHVYGSGESAWDWRQCPDFYFAWTAAKRKSEVGIFFLLLCVSCLWYFNGSHHFDFYESIIENIGQQ